MTAKSGFYVTAGAGSYDLRCLNAAVCLTLSEAHYDIPHFNISSPLSEQQALTCKIINCPNNSV